MHHFDYSILIHATQLLSESVEQRKKKKHECWKRIKESSLYRKIYNNMAVREIFELGVLEICSIH